MMNTINLKGHEFVIRYISHVKANEGFNIHTLRVDSIFGSYDILYDTAEERDSDLRKIINVINEIETQIKAVYALHCKDDDGNMWCNVYKTHDAAHLAMVSQIKDEVTDYDDEWWYTYEENEYGEIVPVDEPDMSFGEHDVPPYHYGWTKWGGYCSFGSYTAWEITKCEI